MDFSIRSYKKELLDNVDIPFTAIKKNMEELEFINKHLGGHRATIRAFRKLNSDRKEINVCEIGCGSGDNLLAIDSWCKKRKIKAIFTGIDINPSCISIARSKSPNGNFNFITSDYRNFVFGDFKPDIVFTSLFCHHLQDEELIPLLKWMMNNSILGVFINDLHRHPLAYYLIKWLTKFFSGSYLVKNDAPLSVLRGFTKNDWRLLMNKSGFKDYLLLWQWAFRWVVIIEQTLHNGNS
jgi:2-polyprenyl-3-methyl-5-hydroxy-6-metoxy-1,4-benzoquinol methylase